MPRLSDDQKNALRNAILSFQGSQKDANENQKQAYPPVTMDQMYPESLDLAEKLDKKLVRVKAIVESLKQQQASPLLGFVVDPADWLKCFLASDTLITLLNFNDDIVVENFGPFKTVILEELETLKGMGAKNSKKRIRENLEKIEALNHRNALYNKGHDANQALESAILQNNHDDVVFWLMKGGEIKAENTSFLAVNKKALTKSLIAMFPKQAARTLGISALDPTTTLGQIIYTDSKNTGKEAVFGKAARKIEKALRSYGIEKADINQETELPPKAKSADYLKSRLKQKTKKEKSSTFSNISKWLKNDNKAHDANDTTGLHSKNSNDNSHGSGSINGVIGLPGGARFSFDQKAILNEDLEKPQPNLEAFYQALMLKEDSTSQISLKFLEACEAENWDHAAFWLAKGADISEWNVVVDKNKNETIIWIYAFLRKHKTKLISAIIDLNDQKDSNGLLIRFLNANDILGEKITYFARHEKISDAGIGSGQAKRILNILKERGIDLEELPSSIPGFEIKEKDKTIKSQAKSTTMKVLANTGRNGPGRFHMPRNHQQRNGNKHAPDDVIYTQSV